MMGKLSLCRRFAVVSRVTRIPRIEYPVIELFTLKALAVEEEVSYAHLRNMVTRITSGEIDKWKGWKFVRTGPAPRGEWLAYQGDFEVKIYLE